VISNKTETAMARAKGDDRPKARIVLTDGAFIHRHKLHPDVVKDNDNMNDHQRLSVGDKVMLTDAEFDAHRAAGVCMVNEDERDAA